MSDILLSTPSRRRTRPPLFPSPPSPETTTRIARGAAPSHRAPGGGGNHRWSVGLRNYRTSSSRNPFATGGRAFERAGPPSVPESRRRPYEVGHHAPAGRSRARTAARPVAVRSPRAVRADAFAVPSRVNRSVNLKFNGVGTVTFGQESRTSRNAMALIRAHPIVAIGAAGCAVHSTVASGRPGVRPWRITHVPPQDGPVSRSSPLPVLVPVGFLPLGPRPESAAPAGPPSAASRTRAVGACR